MKKKSLDELFQEKFKGFEQTPDERVWSSIEASLDKRRKKRVLPLWWQLGGVAAILLIGLLIFNPFAESVIPSDATISDTEKTDNEIESSKNDPIKAIENTNALSAEETEEEPDGKNSTILNNSIVNTEDSKSNGETNESKIKKEYYSSTKFQVAETTNGSRKNSKDYAILPNQDPKGLLNGDDKIALQEKVDRNSDSDKESISDSERHQIISDNQAIASNEKNKEIKTDDPQDKKSLFEEIKNQEEKEEAIAEKSKNRWSAGPSIAPVYFDAMGEGSPVSPIFSANSKSGNVNLSYGLSVAYEISPKLSVRSGVHKVDYAYNTNDVYFTSSIAAMSQGQIANINYAQTAENIVVSGSSSTLNVSSKSFDVSAKNVSKSGVMSQQLGYLEVPVELSYALVNHKFGLNVIGGVSSLFLTGNEVDLTSGDLTTQIGEANNVNDVNFSANFGIGMGYQFSQKFRLNIEPVFKYQLNTFSNVDGSFNPYSIGVYSGLSFRF